MEIADVVQDSYYETSKTWAKHKRAKKYAERRDFRKSCPNGINLKRLNKGYIDDELEIVNNSKTFWMRDLYKCGITPIDKYFNSKPNTTDIHQNLNDILSVTNPNCIEYHKEGSYRCRYQNEWVIYYQYSIQQQYEAHLNKIKQQKLLNQHNKEYTKEKYVYSGIIKSQKKEYKPPDIQEAEINYIESPRIINFDKQRYIQYDLGKNKWITAFGTKWDNIYRLRHNIRSEIGKYKLFVAVDEEDAYNRFFGIETKSKSNNKYKNRKRDKKKNITKQKTEQLTERQKRKKDRKQKFKERKLKKMSNKIKWEFVGVFDGSLDDYYYNKKNEYISFYKMHKINYKKYIDYNDKNGIKKNYTKNGKLCRWIKLIPFDINYDFDKLNCKIYGIDVDEHSQPILPIKTKCKHNNIDDNKNHIDIKCIQFDESQFNKNRNFKIGSNIEINDNFKGCKVIFREITKKKTFGRKVDGWIGRKCGCISLIGQSKNKYNRQYASYLNTLNKTTKFNDWDIKRSCSLLIDTFYPKSCYNFC